MKHFIIHIFIILFHINYNLLLFCRLRRHRRCCCCRCCCCCCCCCDQPTDRVNAEQSAFSKDGKYEAEICSNTYIWYHLMLHSTLCVFVFVAFSVSSSLPTSQMECHKSLFYLEVGFFSFVSLSLSTANPCDSIQMFLPLLCLYCWMSAAAGLFQVSHIQLNPASAALHCEPSSPAQ